jgi:CBS-domain-containing membrane protein
MSMKVTACMKRDVVSVDADTNINEAMHIFIKKHIGTLPVVDEDNKPVGVIGMRDLLNLEMPTFLDFVEDVDFVHDFGAVEDLHPSAATLKKSVKSIMRPVSTVDDDCGLLRAYSLMLQQNLHDIPVVSKDGRLVGIASRVDIGVAILSTWIKAEP